MRSAPLRLRPALALALLAGFAQLCLPLVHAALMAAARAETAGWCGDSSRALAFAAELPPEIRAALELDGVNADRLADCAKLCATGASPTPIAVASTLVLRAAGLEPAPATRTPAPRPRELALRPPSQGPPAHA
jgi:hypothetical protein